MQLHSGHIAKLDRTLKVPDCTMYSQAFGCFPHTFAVNAVLGLSGLDIFTSACVFRCGAQFAAVAVSLQWLFCCKTSFAAQPLSHWIQLVCRRDTAGFLKWTFAVMQLVICTLRQRPSPPFSSIERIPQTINERHL